MRIAQRVLEVACVIIIAFLFFGDKTLWEVIVGAGLLTIISISSYERGNSAAKRIFYKSLGMEDSK